MPDVATNVISAAAEIVGEMLDIAVSLPGSYGRKTRKSFGIVAHRRRKALVAATGCGQSGQ